MTVDEEKYINKNVAYYDAIFRKLRSRRNRADWNWAAFLCPVSWLFYRKMYKLGIACVAVYAAICFIGGIVTLGLTLVIRLYLGVSGNSFYLEHIEAVARGGQRLRESERLRYSKLHCGTSFVLAVLAFAGMTTIVCVIFYFFYY